MSVNNIVSTPGEKRKSTFTIQKAIRLPERPVSSHAGRLYNVFESEAHGLKSMSSWKKEKREVFPGCDPVGFVVTKVQVVEYLRGTEYAVLEVLADGQFRVAWDGWYVYSHDQTQPKSKKRKSSNVSQSPTSSSHPASNVVASAGQEITEPSPPETSSNSFSILDPSLPSSSSSSSFSPLVSTISGGGAPNPNPDSQFGVNNRHDKIWEVLDGKARRRAQRPSAYVPEIWSEDMGHLQEEVYSFFHLMRVYQLVHGLDDDDWVDMAFEQSDRLIPNYPKVLKLLLGSKKIVERTPVWEHPLGFEIPRGIEGVTMYGIHKAYGYRLTNPDYRHGRWTKRPITKPSILRKLDDYENVRYPVQRWLKQNNTCLEVASVQEEFFHAIAEADFQAQNSGAVETRATAYRKMLRLIQDRTWLCTFDPFAGRYHNNATALKRELRQCLRVGGSPLVEIDIKAAQPLFLGLLAYRRGIPGADRFLRICEEDLYQHLADMGGWPREHVKEQLMQRAMFSPNTSHWQKTAVKKCFDREFPEMARFFREAKYGRKTKDNPKPHNKLARMAQKAEVKFVIFTVCDRVRRERPECWLTTIHDSVLCLPIDGEYVRSVMLDEFAKLGVKPRLEVRQLCST